MAAIAHHIKREGGEVAGSVALTGKDYSKILSLLDESLRHVRERLSDLEPAFRDATGHDFDALTESEGRTLATWKPLDAVRSRILEERSERSARMDAEKSQGTVYSLGPADVAGILSGDVLARIKDSLRRAQAMSRIAKNFQELQVSTHRALMASHVVFSGEFG